ncbi:flagellar assembly peptidoglycan hydrolase FlgJ [Atopomonas sediminilitoris]|uniref:flagellar assembly peptidoglycan hydrolase FlgJ n=1 Tax=Atopomonas sediminilitoris TaxID=2919919 RepID=UPI001F4EF3F4|nr:flagellar assembly peptidoglycan hydrolase FlgJ [Atopomonas sediminilitoris]MCJ8167964.1 flagellar assembly peptidoglycan hydrolase FlgJ [Atopomonas sediminilitoris]
MSIDYDMNASYTDLNRLNKLKVGEQKNSLENITKVAREFESLFVNEMLKAMRKATEVFSEDNYLNSKETKFYQDMYDQQLSVSLAQKPGIGLADVLVRQMSQLQEGVQRANPFPQMATPDSDSAPVVSGKSLSRKNVVAAPDSARDDSGLINQRRLSLPGKLTDRVLAGIVPPSAVANNDAAQSFAAPEAPAVQGADLFQGRRLAQPPLAPSKSAFANAQDFIEHMLPMAEQAAGELGVEPRFLVAQAALETGWGKHMIRTGEGKSSHNLFGIKTHNSWEGDSARVVTTEFVGNKRERQVANFRAYDSYADSFNDYVAFLKSNPRYQEALASADNGDVYARELQKAGYATDPQYARKISQIARQMQTYTHIAAATGSTPAG